MRRFPVVSVLAALLTAILVALLSGCGGGSSSSSSGVATIVLTPTMLSLNEGGVGSLSAVAENTNGNVIAADITFSSSNTNIVTVSSGGLVCGGIWDGNIINCQPVVGQAGVGQVTITATSGKVSATATVYVHLKVDRVIVNPLNGCTSMGQMIPATASVYSTSAPGCSQSAPCDITSTVGPIVYGSNDLTIAANSAGIDPMFSSATDSPTYSSGGTIAGSTGQTCNLSNFNNVVGATATVALTGKNAIASGTHLTITASGFGANTPPTTATLSNGSATCSGTANVITALTGNNIFAAQNPGTTTIFGSVSGVNSVSVPYLTCPAVSILVHDANSSNTTFSLNTAGTQPLTADVYDSMGQYIKPKLTWASSAPASVTVAIGTTGNNPATITAVAPGTASITASCSDPDCNRNLPAQYSLNVVTASVSGTSSTTVLAASTNSTMLVPIATAGNTVGTTITLPYQPNSIFADPAGNFLYLGSSSALMVVSLSTGAVTTEAITGTIVAISPDSNFMLLSDSVANAVYYYALPSQTKTFSRGAVTTNSSAYTPDSKYNEWVNGPNLAFGLETTLLGIAPLPYTANALGISAQGGLTYITGSSPAEIDVRSTCNQAEVPPMLSANNPTLIEPIPNGTGAVATDSPSIDVVSTPGTQSSGCPVTTQSTVSTFGMGVGPFKAAQLFMSPDSSRAWIISDLPELLEFNLQSSTPVVVPYAGGAVAYSGGITLDGAQVYVGASDGTVHRIDVASSSDAQQIGVGLKDANGNLVAPNLVAVRP